jgi:transcriptional regulator with XRE-family HTH domain
MSIPELAETAGLSAPAIYNIESGRISNPRAETIRKLERALGIALSVETKEEIREEATIKGLGEFVEFDPHNDGDLPSEPGIYMLYDISERPIYVGQGSNIRNRIRSDQEKFWFKRPIVETAAYVKIEGKNLREKVEKLLIRFMKSNAVINKQNVER